MALEFCDWGKFFVLFVLKVVLAGDLIVQEKSAVFGFEGGVEAGLVADGCLINGLQVDRNEFLIFLKVSELLLEE